MYVKSEKFNFKKHFYNLGDIMGKKLLDIMRDKIRVKHYSLKTENVYIYWAKKYILFHNKRHPNTMGKKEIEEYLTYLAKNLNVSPTTQNQAFYSIVFLYEQVLNISLKNDRQLVTNMSLINESSTTCYIWQSLTLG